MNIAGARVAGFLRDPDPTIRAVLIHGVDRGLVRERADLLVAAVAGDPSDPFRVAELAARTVKDDPATLADEAAALSLTGGRRAVRIRDATDAVSDACAAMLDTTPGAALVVVEAGALAKRSSLRQLFETAADAVAIACYEDQGEVLATLISDTMRRHGLTVTAEALDFLAANLGSDRAVTRSELEKLALYVDGEETVRLEDAQAVVGDSAALSVETTILAACRGDVRAVARALDRAFAEGVQPVSMLRTAARHLQRLHLARAHIAAGRTAEQAMAALRPPVFKGIAGRFREQLRRWNEGRLAVALHLVTEAEIDCKTTGMPAAAICGRTLMRLAQAARASGSDR